MEGLQSTTRGASLQLEKEETHWLSDLPSELSPLVMAHIVMPMDAQSIGTVRLVCRDWNKRVSAMVAVCSVRSEKQLSTALHKFLGLETVKLQYCFQGRLNIAIQTLLSKLPRLQALELHSYDFYHSSTTGFGDLNSITNIARLKELRINGRHLLDASFLATQLPHLQALHLVSLKSWSTPGQRVTAFGGLSQMQDLRRLTLQEVCFDLDPLYELTRLEELDLWSRDYSGDELYFLEPLTNLRSLGVAGFPHVDNFDFLSKLTALCTLRLMRLGDIEDQPLDVSRLSNLQTLQLVGLSCGPPLGLQRLTKLEKLCLEEMCGPVRDGPPTSLTGLRHLKLRSNQWGIGIDQFIPPAQLSHLTFLDIDGSYGFRNASFIAQLPSLSSLVLHWWNFWEWIVSNEGVSTLARSQHVVLRGEGRSKGGLVSQIISPSSSQMVACGSEADVQQCVKPIDMQCDCSAHRHWVCSWENPGTFFRLTIR